MVTCWTKLVVNRYKHLLVFRVWSGWCIMQCICIYIAWRDDILYIGKYLPLFEFSPLSFSLSVVNLRHCKFRTIFKQLCLFKLCIYYCVWAKSRQVKTICINKGQKNLGGKNNPVYSSITGDYVYVLVAHSTGRLAAVIVNGLWYFSVYIYLYLMKGLGKPSAGNIHMPYEIFVKDNTCMLKKIEK